MENFENFFNNDNLKNEVTNDELARLANDNTFNILMGNTTVDELFNQNIDIPLLIDPSQGSISDESKVEILDSMIEYYVEEEDYEKCNELVKLKNKL
jgi:hypothetical protein